MATLTGKGLATHSKSKKGTPYVYGAKGADGVFTQVKLNWLATNYRNVFTTNYLNKIAQKGLVGKVCNDCSGLISWYTGKVMGSSQLYSNAYARMPISEVDKFAVGTVLWKQGHVGVYLGDGLVAESKGIDYGTVITKVGATKWTYGLTFSWMEYDIEERVDSELITYKTNNPYLVNAIPTMRKGNRSDAVKWLQWELIESGYPVLVDGYFGPKTDNAVRAYQRSCKLYVDGVVGPKTIKALLSNEGSNPYTKPTGIIKKGSKGTTVKWLQWELNQHGENLLIDGDFGTKTDTALRKFQKENNLYVDGECGPKSIKALEETI